MDHAGGRFPHGELSYSYSYSYSYPYTYSHTQPYSCSSNAYLRPSQLCGTKVALDAGVDVIAHAIEDTRGIDDALLLRMKTQHTAIVPTLALFADAGADMGAIRAQIARYAAMGGELLFGTDVGYIKRYDTRLELEQLAKSGLTARQILGMLTRAPAARFGAARSRGRIAPGFDGDLTVLARDPLVDPSAFADVRYTIRGGRIIFRAPAKSPH